MKTKAVVFDAYGTLFDVNSAAEKCKSKIGDKWETFANFWRTTQLQYTWLRSLMKRHKNFWDVTEDSLDKSMKEFNIDKSMKNDLLSLYKVLSPYPEVKRVLEDLKKKKIKLAILSNGTPTLLRELVESNNLNNLFDDLFSVEEVRVYKPDSRVYEIPIKKYNIPAKEIFFLSANTWDVCGGGNYGYNAIWVNRNKTQFDNLDYQPKYEIDNLSQLLDIVKS
ncbi:MAG: haloacid dehalogenase, type II [Pelagibacteraceae bacterium TMED216]|nr:MAG: haloacid dehalogenase, type II [Pelagibacteraceae bacterium TMED216]|tara:strand:+ start:4346 stop:5011 length:666 start_codon:yes stop_codon:yes gene_type:complete